MFYRKKRSPNFVNVSSHLINIMYSTSIQKRVYKIMTILVMHLRSVSFTFVARGLDLDNWSDLHGHTRQNGVGPIIESGIRTIFQPYDGNWVPFVYHAVTLDIRWIWFHAPLYLPWHHDDRYKDP